MICLKNPSDEHLDRIASAFAEAFLHEEGTISRAFESEQAKIYFRLTLQEYARTGKLYALSENEEGYIVFHNSREDLPWYRELLLFIRYMRFMKIESMQKLILVRRGWREYTLKFTHLKEYINVAFLCVRVDQQGKGYLSKLLEEPFRQASERNIPCILDTDSELKAAKYGSCGMRKTDDSVLESGVHMYTMIFDPKQAH